MNREEIIEVICDLYEELKISILGFNLKEVCNKLDINLIPYYLFEDSSLLLKLDEDGFNCINPKSSKIEIYYNDRIYPKQRIKFTIPHEIGHIVLNHNIKKGEYAFDQNKEAEKANKDLILQLLSTIKSRINVLNKGRFIIEDYCTEYYENL